MTESPVQVDYAVPPLSITLNSNANAMLINGKDTSTASTSKKNSATPRTPTSLLMSARRPALKLTLSSEEQADFSAAIMEARGRMVSDAAKLPASTNMGLGNRPAPTSAIAPASRAQPISQSQRAIIPTKQENEQATRDAHRATSHSWEEDDAEPKSVYRATASKAAFLQAIPCFFVANVKSATTFYKDILGFQMLGKADSSHVSLYRAPPQQKAPIKKNPYDPPPGSVQMYLRIAPMGSDGVRVKPPPGTLWMLVNDVDEVFKEIMIKWSRFQPKDDEYFPTHLFGEAKILAKPQNKAWGTRELHVVDGDENKIIFFKHVY